MATVCERGAAVTGLLEMAADGEPSILDPPALLEKCKIQIVCEQCSFFMIGTKSHLKRCCVSHDGHTCSHMSLCLEGERVQFNILTRAQESSGIQLLGDGGWRG